MKCTSSIALLILIILPLIVIIVLLTLPIDILADAANTTVIQINITQVAQISVSPAALNWSQVSPGSNGTVQTVTVTNIGSTTFTNGIYVSADSWVNTTNNPTPPNTDPTKYMAATFLVIANSTDSANNVYWFVEQISWNETNYITPSPTGANPSAKSWGYYRNITNWWLWELKNASGDSSCRNGTDGATLTIVQTPGSTNLGTNYTANFVTNNSQTWGIWNFTSGALKDYCVATHTSCNYILIYKYDLNNTGLGSCGAQRGYLAPSSSFGPGQSVSFSVKPHIPSATIAGTVWNSTVTFTAA